MIRDARTQHIYMHIPGDLLRTNWGNMDGLPAIKLILSRLSWFNERTLRIVNEGNLDCLYEMCSTDPKDSSIEARYLKLVSVVKVDNLHENMLIQDSAHLLHDRVTLHKRDVLERLIRVN